MAAKLVVVAVFLSVANSERFIDPMINPDLFQGDLIGVDHIPDRNAITERSQRWPNGVIPYSYDQAMLQCIAQIHQAMKHIEDNTCIKFEEYDGTQPNYVHFFPGQGCYSNWGKIGGRQQISLGNGCGTVGMTLHEILHAVGFHHEHSRSDRDDYLIIYMQNIQEDVRKEFVKLQPHQNWLINAFDYGSIMIYGDTAGSIDGRSKTMVAKKPGATFLNPDQKYSLSASDIQRINILYECKNKMA